MTDSGVIELNLAPKGKGPPLSLLYEGEKSSWSKDPEEPFGVVSQKSGLKGTNCFFSCDPPFDEMFIIGGGPEVNLQHLEILRCEKESDWNTISDRVNRSTYKIESTEGESWFKPKFGYKNPEGILLDIEGRFDMTFRSIEELLRDDRWKQISQKEVMVTRIMGWTGYFWFELSNDIQKTRKNFCPNCGKVIKLAKNKKYCSIEENKECFLQRQKLRQRRHREIKGQVGDGTAAKEER